MKYFNRCRKVIELFFRKNMVRQVYTLTLGIHVFHFCKNFRNRTWLFNESLIYKDRNQIGGWYRVNKKTFTFNNMDAALIPRILYPAAIGFSFLDLEYLFFFMDSASAEVKFWGFRGVFLVDENISYDVNDEKNVLGIKAY